MENQSYPFKSKAKKKNLLPVACHWHNFIDNNASISAYQFHKPVVQMFSWQWQQHWVYRRRSLPMRNFKDKISVLISAPIFKPYRFWISALMKEDYTWPSATFLCSQSILVCLKQEQEGNLTELYSTPALQSAGQLCANLSPDYKVVPSLGLPPWT